MTEVILHRADDNDELYKEQCEIFQKAYQKLSDKDKEYLHNFITAEEIRAILWRYIDYKEYLLLVPEVIHQILLYDTKNTMIYLEDSNKIRYTTTGELL